MKDSTKKWLTITGGLVICAILVFVIAQQFTKEKATDALPPTSSSQQGEVVVDPDGSNPTTDPDASSDISEDDLTINPQTSPNDTGTNAGNGAISSGTEQTIQADPEVPEKPDEETLTDAGGKDNGIYAAQSRNVTTNEFDNAINIAFHALNGGGFTTQISSFKIARITIAA